MKHPPPNQKIGASLCQRTAIAILCFSFCCAPSVIDAQGTAPITESGLNTQVSGAINVGGKIQYNITGGTRPGDGANVFHSFGNFGIPLNNIANFNNNTGLPTANILSRVTGNTPSTILGTLRTEGFGDANLFLLNPNGVVFGPNASLDLTGSFHVSTADSIQLGTGTEAGLFSANDPALDILTSAPPSAFGFSNTNPLSSIAIRGANLQVQPGNIISIIGGDPDSTPQNNPQGDFVSDPNPGILITDKSTISAPQGQINVVSVAGPGTVTTTGPKLTPDFPLSAFNQLGTVTITDQSVIDVGGNGAGTIVIRGGRLTLDTGAQITAATLGAIDAGSVSIDVSENVTLDGALISVESTGRGSGNAGDVTITAGGNVLLSGRTGTKVSTISSSAREVSEGALGEGLLGSGGTITIDARNLSLNEGAKIIANTLGDNSSPPAAGFLTQTLPSSGNVKVTVTDTLTISDTIINGEDKLSPSEISVGVTGPATVGAIAVKAGTIEIRKGAEISASSDSTTPTIGQGSLSVEATETLTIDGFQGRANQEIFNQSVRLSGIRAQTRGPQDAASIAVHAKNLVLSNGGQIVSTPTINPEEIPISESRGAGGNITIDVTENILIGGRGKARGFGDRSSIVSVARASGKAGDISLTAVNLTVEDGGIISTASQPSEGVVNPGAGGTVSINVRGDVKVSGVNTEITDSPLKSQISSETFGAADAGDVVVTAKKVDVMAGGLISSSTGGRGSGDAGNVTITALDGDVMVSGRTGKNISSITSSAFESIDDEGAPLGNGLLGSGGTVRITAQNVTLNEGGNITAQSTGSPSNPAAASLGEEDTLPSSGRVELTVTDTLIISDAIINSADRLIPSQISVGVIGPATVGDITVKAGTIEIRKGGEISASSDSKTPTTGRGSLTVEATETLTIDGFQGRVDQEIFNQSVRRSGIRAQTRGPQDAANIVVNAKNLIVSNGAEIVSTPTIDRRNIPLSESRGAGGNITIDVTENIAIAGRGNSREFGDQSSILSVARASGKAGDISLTAANLVVEDGGVISTSSQPSEGVVKPGPGGTVAINVRGNVRISGVNTEFAEFEHGRVLPSRIGSGTDSAADAGNISVTANNIIVSDGGTITAGTSGNGNGGFVRLDAVQTVSIQGGSPFEGKTTRSTVLSRSEAGGNGGTITITGETIAIQDGARVSTTASGTGNPGDINLVNAQEILLDGGILETEAAQEFGGNIKLTASNLIFLNNAQILSSVDSVNQTGATLGGNINIDPDFIVLINSQIRADAEQGQGGTISLVADNIFRDLFNPNSTTEITAKSGPGNVEGSINIQAPIQNLSQAIAPLPESIVEVAALYSAQCAGQKNGQFSSFTQRGLDRIPYEPGDLLPTPLFLPNVSLDQSKTKNQSSSPVVRRLELPGFDSTTSLVSTWNFSRVGCRS